MSRAVILANGVAPESATIEAALEGASLFVCADGGANTARELGLAPDAIVGDLDSASRETLKHFADVPQIKDADLERTDTEKAIEYVLSRGPHEEITLLAASEGRLDHLLGHLSLLRKFAARTTVVLRDDHGRSWLASGNVELDLPLGTTVSFFAVGAPAEGVTTENLRFALTDATMALGGQDSMSNVTSGRPARIRIARGELLISVVTRP
ncbi:MAG TPA: thiamine diphosphokinase [Candidatus Eisenbacteria bacterium]|nr:thiamine diphosphokinase [Candidatus Eisenbacteria bacterium]